MIHNKSIQITLVHLVHFLPEWQSVFLQQTEKNKLLWN